MAYKVLDIYKDLPRTNCGDCGKASCFAFASAVYLEAFPFEKCPHLSAAARETMDARLEEGREAGEGRRPASSEQALRSLLALVAVTDMQTQAERSGCTLLEGPEQGVALRFLGETYRVTPDGVTAETAAGTSVSVKILLLIYLTRAGGRPESDSWTAFRDLPNTVSKAVSFEGSAARVAAAFSGRPEGLEQAVRNVGGRPVEPGSADLAFEVPVLPRVTFLLLFWDAEEEFAARVSLLVDRVVLDYLDQEAVVFSAEALAARLLGEDVDQIVA